MVRVLEQQGFSRHTDPNVFRGQAGDLLCGARACESVREMVGMAPRSRLALLKGLLKSLEEHRSAPEEAEFSPPHLV